MSELVQVCVYPETDLQTVEADAVATDPLAQRLRGQVLGIDLALNARLSFALLVDPPLDVSPPVASLIWRGRSVSVTFAVKIPRVDRRVRALGTVEVRLDGSAFPIGVIHFRLELVPNGTRTLSVAQHTGELARVTDSVFVSYASEDRAEVLRRVQGLKALGIQFFQDIMSLSPGQAWAEEFQNAIDRSDVFLLCWSSAASKSEWVRKEYLQAQALTSKSADGRPHIASCPWKDRRRRSRHPS